ncbi:MAG TPA: metallopeptidase TldD-related protein [Thermoanaerobaculia bacterium]|nr:metallopeptidase TldD-related protein [Thermoanaerobaculia bacterium]
MLSTALAGSVADAVELVWIETLAARAVAGGRRGARPSRQPRRRLLLEVRVQEGSRTGFHRSGATSAGELMAALRIALGQSRLALPGPPLRLAPATSTAAATTGLHDPDVADLDGERAHGILAGGLGEDDRLVLDWSEVRLAVVNSRGLARAVEATAVTLAASHGRAPGIGRATGSARSLAALGAATVAARARRRATPEGSVEAPPAAAVPVVLAAEASAALVAFLAAHALSSRSFLEAGSPFAGHLGEPVAHPGLTLVDDGNDPSGLPFPCDLSGFPRERVVMVEAGVPRTPAIDEALSTVLRRPPTHHASSLEEARPEHLFLVAGKTRPDELAAAADGGLWIGELSQLRLLGPSGGAVGGLARNVRRLIAGAPAAPLPDLLWQTDLSALLRGPLAVGDDPVALATPDGIGAASAPSLALPAVGSFRAAG